MGRPGQLPGQLDGMTILKNMVKVKESGPGTFIFEFSVKLRFEWYQFRRLKPKPCPVGDKTVFQMSQTTSGGGGDYIYRYVLFLFGENKVSKIK